MSDTGDAELEKRLAALEKGGIARVHPRLDASPLLALIVVALVSARVAPCSIIVSGPDEEERLCQQPHLMCFKTRVTALARSKHPLPPPRNPKLS